jgi:hypothetical protein
MPTKSVALAAATGTKVADADPNRTVLIFSNQDDTDLIFVSDEQGVTTTGILIAPQMTVVLGLSDGWNTKAAHWAYCAGATTLNVGEGTQWLSPVVVIDPSGGDGLPHPKDPPM